MKNNIFTLTFCSINILISTTASAQNLDAGIDAAPSAVNFPDSSADPMRVDFVLPWVHDPRVPALADRLLARVPDAPMTARAFGRGEERRQKAIEHAMAIIAAADFYRERWEGFVEAGNWQYFDPHNDLAPLIAAIAYNESRFHPVVRLDNNRRIYGRIPTWGRRRRPIRADIGIMQVRAPTPAATRCGVATRADLDRLLTDLNFIYKVGTCILTGHLAHFVPLYTRRNYNQFGRWQRPPRVLRFFGVVGSRRNTPVAMRARELAVLERYNWGYQRLYHHERASGYSVRVLSEFEFFRTEPPMTPAPPAATPRPRPAAPASPSINTLQTPNFEFLLSS